MLEVVAFTSMHTPCFVGTPGISEDRVSPGPLARVPGGLRAQGRGRAAGPAGISPPLRLGQPSAEQSAQSQASSLSETWHPSFGRRGLGFQTVTPLWFPPSPACSVVTRGRLFLRGPLWGPGAPGCVSRRCDSSSTLGSDGRHWTALPGSRFQSVATTSCVLLLA